MECERCGSTRPPIVYGLPTDEEKAAAARGEVQLAACAIPTYPTCKACGNRIEKPQENRLQHAVNQLRRMV